MESLCDVRIPTRGACVPTAIPSGSGDTRALLVTLLLFVTSPHLHVVRTQFHAPYTLRFVVPGWSTPLSPCSPSTFASTPPRHAPESLHRPRGHGSMGDMIIVGADRQGFKTTDSTDCTQISTDESSKSATIRAYSRRKKIRRPEATATRMGVHCQCWLNGAQGFLDYVERQPTSRRISSFSPR